jgi:FkbM family methyltransferase
MFEGVVKKGLSKTVWHLLGRKNMVRLGRFLSNEARLDTGNDLASNGERRVQACLREILSDGESRVVFDIGANIGEWSKALIEQSRGWKAPLFVHAFEPCSSTYSTLIQNLESWRITDKVKPHRIALSAEEGERTFYSLGENQGRNSLYPHERESQSVAIVPCSTIDRWCEEAGIARLFFVKIDTEGHDYEVLIGAKEMLKSARIDMLQFEYNHRWIAARRFLIDAFELLLPLGYVIGKITERGVEFYSDGWDFELETFREGNYLAVQQEYKSAFPTVKWWNAK